MKSANGILDDKTDRKALQMEFTELSGEIDRVGETANFNGNKLFVEREIMSTPDKPVTQMGDFKIIGDASNVSYSGGVLTVSGSEDIVIEGKGTASTDRIQIADGITANVTLKNVNISLTSEGDALNIGDGSTLNLTLVGTNTLKSFSSTIIWNVRGYAGVHLDGNSNLVITENSTGSLNAIGGGYGAGIGKTNQSRANGGNITINGGTITAIGSADSTGIGACWNCSIGNITINGGTITANGDGSSAGIGAAYNTTCGDITITGGTITANGGSNGAHVAAGIGAAWVAPCGRINITGGTITTNYGVKAPDTGTTAYVTKNNCIIDGVTYGTPAPSTPPSPSGNDDVLKKRNKIWALQIGETHDDMLLIDLGIVNSNELGLSGLSISTQNTSMTAATQIKESINKLSIQRAQIGAYQNRLDYTINNLDTAKENTESAKSRIKDTDMAKEMMEYTKNNVLMQSAQAMLAQANTQPNNVLSLLQ